MNAVAKKLKLDIAGVDVTNAEPFFESSTADETAYQHMKDAIVERPPLEFPTFRARRPSRRDAARLESFMSYFPSSRAA